MDGWMDGWMRTSVHGCNPSLRNIHWPLIPPPCPTGSALGRVIPTNRLIHGCKYSTGVNLTILGLLVMQLQLPDKESITNFSILFVPTKKT